MKLKLPIHFQARISERELNIEYIKRAIKEPDFKKDAFQGRTLVRKDFDGKTIEVIYSKHPKTNEYAIITAYYL